jgi:hypothetical protein
MIDEMERRRSLCERADTADWEDLVARARPFSTAQKAYLAEHPPGLVGALWQHFARTRERCGCTTAAHEQADCRVPLIERLLLDQETV